jgi:hypothetical protein
MAMPAEPQHADRSIEEVTMRARTPMGLIAAILLLCSVVTYYVQILIFKDADHTFFYFLQDLAFVPIQVLLVVLLIERVLENRERQLILHKLNMVIGAFFSEIGTRLLGDLTPAVEGMEEVRQRLALTGAWKRREFAAAIAFARGFQYKIDPQRIDLVALRDLLVAKREFMVRLLENPNLLEHERFTDLLWAVFHLTEELSSRPTLPNLGERDIEHIAGDIRRAYSQLAAQWIAYAQHLQVTYPFLFSLVARTHPMQERPQAEIA